ncbi:MAG: hypothetical protein IPJ30_23140 [Acidobacteria bacterium]|nr:hypothetical protein [Acidobacteriota bacterium]
MIGGAIGIGIAYAIAKLVALFFDSDVAASALGRDRADGIEQRRLISGVFPAWKADGLNLIEAWD